LAPQDLFVNFTGDESATANVEPEVLGYVQQMNVDRMVQEAVRMAGTNAAGARQTLQAAMGMTQRLGNAGVSQMLTAAINELDRTGTISSSMRKTVALGARTRTMKTGAAEPLDGVPSEEEIRRLTGA
jgi:Ca-activated chloride channel family protein